MKLNRFTIAACGMTIALAGIGAWTMIEERDDEVVIKLGEAPEAVRTTVAKLTPADKVTKVIKESDEGLTLYEVEYTKDGANCSAALSGLGEVMELEKAVPEASLPAAVLAELKKEYPKATFKNPVSVQKFYFEIAVVIDGKSHEVKVDAAGNIEDEQAKDQDDEKDEKGKGEKKEGKKGEKDDD